MSDVDEELKAAQARVGETVGGKWRLDRLIGVGGMASVYAATHKNNLKVVAVKVLHAELQRHEGVRTRFLREGYVANKVAHPGVVSAIDDGVDEGGAVFIVMELLTGKSLAERFDEMGGKLPAREVLQIADGLLDVLAAAHAQGVVHRDLKPDNVFLTEDGGVKVLDFGVARVLEGGGTGDAKTKTGIVMGTPEYMPQEQARGRSEQIDGRTDLWAVAALMWRLLTGRYVHEAETPNEVLLLAMTAPPKKLAEIAPHLSPKVCAVIDKALSFEPDDRYKNAEEMRAAVKEALAALDEQDGKATLVAGAVDPGGKTLAVGDSDIITVDAPKSARSAPSPDESSPKQSLWVHTKATPPAAPKAPKKRRAWIPIVAASGVLALLCVGIAWGVPRMRDARPAPSASTGPSAVAASDESDAEAEAGDDEADDEVDAAPVATTTGPTKPQTTAAASHSAAHPHTKPKTKKKHH